MATNNVTSNNTRCEWESTISVNISAQDYDAVRDSKGHKIDIIFLMKGGIRFAAREMQKKVITSSRKILKLFATQWIPMVRTIATEETVKIPAALEIEKTVHRLAQRPSEDAYKNIRITYNKEINGNGDRYNLELEIEYPECSSYEHVLEQEQLLMQYYVENFAHTMHNIKRSVMTRTNMFSCVMSKIQMWHCFNADEAYVWAFKWNGIKAKILITDEVRMNENNNIPAHLTYLWSDSADIRKVWCSHPHIERLVNICCLVEIMPDCVVLIEAIGALVGEHIYTTEPRTNVEFLKQFATLSVTGDSEWKRQSIDDVPFQIQQFYDNQLPHEYDGKFFDGFIIVQNDLIIKWKIPTVDVKCLVGDMYKVGQDEIKLNFIGMPGKIYEINHMYEVMRMRTDRIAASTQNEYEVFVQSKKYLLDSMARSIL